LHICTLFWLCRKGVFLLLLFPVVKEFLADTKTPISIFGALRKNGPCFLLESVEKGENWGRYSMIGIKPAGEIRFHDGKWDATGEIEIPERNDNPMEVLRNLIQKYTVEIQGGDLPAYVGGLAGFLSYDVIRHYEDLPNRPSIDTSFPDAHFMLVKELVVYDHLKSVIKIIILVPENERVGAFKYAESRIDEIMQQIEKEDIKANTLSHEKLYVKSNFTKQKFMDAVERAKKYIENGEILQVVLSQRLKVTPMPEAFSVYRRLRSLNPSPYMFYFDFSDYSILGSSPECLAKVENGVIETHPIAGTRKRGLNAQEDSVLAKELLSDKKELAEHKMLVELGQDDLGRVSKKDSVYVEDYMHVEKFSHVMHIVSKVKGLLDKDKDSFDALIACFPAGTVSGAPRKRAMEIIDELEPTARGPYAGAVGYFDFRGNMDTCISIRSMFFKDNCAYLQAGAGIVSDSEPEKEYFETLNKLGGLLKALTKDGFNTLDLEE